MPLYKPARFPVPNPPAGSYIFTSSPQGGSTSATLGNNTLRLVSWIVESPLRIDRIQGDIATVGEAGSRYRVGIYADSGGCYPGSLVVDGGQLLGDSATVQDATISTLSLAAGLYWIGGAVQSAPTTQPTVRITSGWVPPVAMFQSSAPAAGGTMVGYSQGSVTGALPGTFTATVGAASSAARLLVRVA